MDLALKRIKKNLLPAFPPLRSPEKISAQRKGKLLDKCDSFTLSRFRGETRIPALGDWEYPPSVRQKIPFPIVQEKDVDPSLWRHAAEVSQTRLLIKTRFGQLPKCV